MRRKQKKSRRKHRNTQKSTRLGYVEVLEDRRLLAVTLVNSAFDGALPGNVRLLGAANYQGGSWVELTPAASGKTGTLRVNGHGQAASDFTVKFNQSIKDSTTPLYPADGIAFGYGALPNGAWGSSGPGRTGGQGGPTVEGLFVKFDTYPNTGTIEVYYNGREVKTWGNLSLRGSFLDTTIRMEGDELSIIHPAGSKKVTIQGWNPSSTWRFGLGASTGFYNDRHIIEDLYVVDETPNAAPQLTYTGDSGNRFDRSLPTFSWDVSDRNGNLNTHQLTLEHLKGDGSWSAIRSVTLNATTTKTAPERFGLEMLPSDTEENGLGKYRAEMIATDKTGRSTIAYSPVVTVIDDDSLGPLVSALLNDMQVVNGGTVTIPHEEADSLTWTISDQQIIDGVLTDSGVESVSVHLFKDDVVVATSSSLIGSLPLTSLGPGTYIIVIDAIDGDRDHGPGATTDQASTHLTAELVLSNQAPELRVGIDRTVRQRQTSRFRTLGYSDSNGDPVSISWSFDDGATITSGAETDYAFFTPGTYTVLTKAEDPYGASTIKSIEVTVANTAPDISDVIYSPSHGVGETVDVQVIAEDEPQSGLTYEIDWDGDGEIDESNGSGVFSRILTPGVRASLLRVIDSEGLATETTVPLAVGDLPSTRPTVSLSATSSNMVEGDDLAITASLSSMTTVDVAVSLEFSGDADAEDYGASSRVIVVPAGQTTGYVVVNVTDDPVFEGDETLAIVPGTVIAADATGDPIEITIIDNESEPDVWFTSAGGTFSESSGSMRFSSQLSHPADKDLVIPLQISGSADAGLDYVLSDTDVLFEAGQTFGVVDLTLVDDDDPEQLETILLRLQDTEGAELSSDPSVSIEYLVNIPASDAPSVTFGTGYVETLESAGAVTLTATLSAPPVTPVAVQGVVSGNAPTPTNFAGIEFLFAPGQTTATANLPIVDDSIPGFEDYSLVTLVDATGATVGPRSQAVVAIADDDIAKVQFSAATSSRVEKNTTYSVSVMLSEPVGESISIPVSIRGGTASMGNDFWIGANPSTREVMLNILAGHQTASFDVTVVEDAVIERDEYFTLQLGQPLNEVGDPSIVQLGALTSHRGVIKNDDVAARVVGVARTVTEGQGSIDIAVELTGKADEPVDVQLRLRGTADPGSEVYFDDGASKTIPFAPGETRKGLKIYIADDNRAEFSEYVEVVATSSADIIGDPPRLVITDTDRVSASFATSDSRYSEGKGQFSIPIRLTDVAEFETVVLVQDPRKGEPDLVTIPAGVREVEYWSDTMDDEGLDRTKYVVFRLVAGIGVDVNPGAAHQVVIEDDDRRSGFWGDIEYQHFINKGNWDEWIDSTSEKAKKLTIGQVAEAAKQFAVDWLRPSNYIGREGCAAIGIGTAAAATAASYGTGSIVAAAVGFAVQSACEAAFNAFVAQIDAPSDDPQIWKDFKQAVADAPERVTVEVEGFLPQSVVLPVDGPLVGGILFFDANKNGVFDFIDLDGDNYQDPLELFEYEIPSLDDGVFVKNVPTEYDANGNGYIDFQDGQLAIAGALDLSTGLELQTPLTAPYGSAILSPLTTLASELVNRYDSTIDESAALVLQAVGISVDSSGFRLYIDDPVLDTAQGETDAAVAFAQGAMVHNTVDQIATFLSRLPGAPNERTAGAATYSVIADYVFTGDRLVLANEFMVASVVRTTAATLGLQVSDSDLQAISHVIAGANRRIADLPVEPGIAFLESVATVQQVAQGAVAEMLGEFAAGQTSLQTLLEQVTGPGMEDLIAIAEPGKLVDPEIRVTDGRLIEGDAGYSHMEFDVSLTFPANAEVSVRYETIDINDAAQGVDFARTLGELSWAAGETGTQKVLVPVYGDTEFEGEEVFEFWVHTPTNAVISRQVGLGYIEDDDRFMHVVSDQSSGEVLVQSLGEGRTVLLEDNHEVFNKVLGSQQEVVVVSSPGHPILVEFDLETNRHIAGHWSIEGTGAGDTLKLRDALAESVVYSNQHEERYVEIDGLRIELNGVPNVESKWLREIVVSGLAEEDSSVILELNAFGSAADRLQAEWTLFDNDEVVIASQGPSLEVYAPDDAIFLVEAHDSIENGPSVVVLSDLIFANTAPTLSVDVGQVVLDEGTSASKNITALDVPADVVDVIASIGLVQPEVSGHWTWSFTGDDDLTTTPVEITAIDEDGGSTSASFNLTVGNVPVSFDAGPDASLVPAEEGRFVRTGIGFTDPGDDQWSGTVDFGDTTDPMPLVIDAAQRQFDLSHQFTSEGTFTVTVQLKDDDSDSLTMDTFDVTVVLNQPPVASDDTLVVPEDDGIRSLTGLLGVADSGLLGNDSDPDGDPLTIVSLDPSAITQGSLQIDAGEVTFDPQDAFESLADNETVTQTFTYTIADPSGATSTASATIVIEGANDAPTLSVDELEVTVDEGETATNTGDFGDVDQSDALTLEASVGEVIRASDGRWSWSWDTQDGPTDTQVVTVSVRDDQTTTSVAFDLVVNNVAPEPSIDSISEPRVEGTEIRVHASAEDPASDGDALTYAFQAWKHVESVELGVNQIANGDFESTPPLTWTGQNGKNYEVFTEIPGWTSAPMSGFLVQTARSYLFVHNLSRAQDVLDGRWSFAENTSLQPTLNFVDTGDNGHFADDAPFPLNSFLDDNNFALSAKGQVYVPSSGPWTFGTNSDDGVRLSVDGDVLTADDRQHAPEDHFATVELEAGWHEVELLYFERRGGATVELFAASGSWDQWDSSFRLVGDVANGGLQVVTPSSIEIQEGDHGTGVTGGNQVAELDVPDNIDNATPRRLQQTVALSESGVYRLSLDVAKRNTDAAANGVEVWLAGELLGSIQPAHNQLITSTFDIPLDAGDHVIELVGLSDTNVGSVVDNVRLEQVITLNEWVLFAEQESASPEFAFTPDDDGEYRVDVEVADKDGDSNAASETVLVDNVAPQLESLTSSHPTLELRSADGWVQLTALIRDPGTVDTHTVDIDWGDGSTTQMAGNAIQDRQVAASHFYVNGGIYPIVVVVTDTQGGTTQLETTAVVTGVGLVGDTLYVLGTDGPDNMDVREVREQTQVHLHLDGSHPRTERFSTDDIAHMEFYTFGGHDRIDVRGHGRVPVRIDAGEGDDRIDTKDTLDWILGGAGNDVIMTGDGDDVVLGGSGSDRIKAGGGNDIVAGLDGHDRIWGNSGRDLVLGGRGRDVLFGGDDDDLLLADIAQHETNVAALRQAMTEWAINEDVNAALVKLGEIADDEEVDRLSGNRGRDELLGALEDSLRD